jgi:TetR/AcrR family fatty acid metabolism transcriptional regulator
MADAEERRRQRKKRGADVARTVIIEAAASVFAQKGYYGTTMDDIANASGYSPAAIYKYFKNKEDLFHHLWNAMAERLQTIFEESARVPLPFPLRLRWMISRLSQLLETSPDFVVAFIAQRPYAAIKTQSTLERQAFEHYLSHRRQIILLVQQGLAEGALRGGDVEDYTNLLIGLLYEFAYKWVTAGGEVDVGDNIERLIDLFMRGAGQPASLAVAVPSRAST